MSFTVRTTAPFRADVVGSYLRPEKLKNARNLHRQGLLDDAGLKQVEDECIRDLIAQQIKHGLRGITDGEFRRSWWHLDFMWGLGGIKRVETKAGFHFVGIDTRAETAALEGQLSGHNHPFVEHFKFVKQFEQDGYGLQARQTVPAPAQTLSNLLKVRDAGTLPRGLCRPLRCRVPQHPDRRLRLGRPARSRLSRQEQARCGTPL